MRKFLAVLLTGVFIFTACGGPAPAPEKVRILAEDYAPFNYVDAKGTVAGSSTDIVKAVMGKLGQNIPVEVMPWAKAYDLTLNNPGTALFSMARSSEREHLFMWVGPIGSYENWLYVKKGSDVRVSSLEEAKAVGKIAAVKNEAGQLKLADQGFINFLYADTSADGLKKLMSGEADLWLGTREGINIVAAKAGVNPDGLQPVVFVLRSDLYLAFNKNTDYATVDAWQKALDSLKK
jgi:ABC-type amino acid transport substrate-binding protein